MANRLASATVSANIAPVKTFTYDAIGNLLSKSDVGTYTYPLAGSALPHAVSVVNGTSNQTAGLGRSISYTSYNKPSSITQGSATLFFSHDIDHQRFKQQAPEGTTLYFDAFGVHAERFSSGTSQWYDYVSAGGAMLGVRVLHSDLSVTTRYFHTDNLGSIAVITDETGAVVERDGYDALGKRRFPNGADDPTGSLTSQVTRGFTGQEELSDVGLVHLNGRVYDPLIARMTSADPMVPDPMNGQAWNRYSYVINNPLAFTDPSGYCFLGLCGLNVISDFFHDIFHQLGKALRRTPILGTIATIAAAALCTGPQAIACAVTAAFLSTAAVAGLASGNHGAALKAGLVAAATAVAFYEVGNLTNAVAGVDPANLPEGQAHIQPQFGTPEYAFNVVAHAAVGCGSAVASGGKCGPSALAGGVTSAAGPVINGQGFVAGLVINTALGGGAAVLGGGKFENGAITSAFGYLFNYLAKIFNDDSFGGHTIERHVGKPIEYLQDRLYLQPDIDAASTYRNLAEATAVTQKLLDDNETRIDAWLADPNAKLGLVLHFLNPFTSPLFFPVGLVLDRDSSTWLPGNGATAVLVRAPNLQNGFYVLTSYPTLNGIPFKE